MMGKCSRLTISFFVVLFFISSGYSEEESPFKDTKEPNKTEQVAMVLEQSRPSVRIVFEQEFKIAPNPVTKTATGCNFFLNPTQKGDAELRIFDLAGNEIFKYRSKVKRYGCDHGKPFFTWNMKNRFGRTIGTGTYLAIITLKSDNGTIKTFKSKIGFKEE
jgi:hypothetical protein